MNPNHLPAPQNNGVDLAKNFLEKLILPAVEEAGLLLRDKVARWKFSNQVNMLNKAREFCEKNDIVTKPVSLKILSPLLENAGLEEDETLQEKWAILLSNLVDSEQNVANHVFPYILGQISLTEFLFLENAFIQKQNVLNELHAELHHFITNRPEEEGKIKVEINEKQQKLREVKKILTNSSSAMVRSLENEINDLSWRLKSLDYRGKALQRKITTPRPLSVHKLREFELSNLMRLGLIKIIQETQASSAPFEIPNHEQILPLSIDLDIELESTLKYVFTELGELFVNACMEKVKQAQVL